MRHLKILDVRARLHARSGIDFDTRYKHGRKGWTGAGLIKLQEKDAFPDRYIDTITPWSAKERCDHIAKRIPSALVLYRMMCLFPTLDVPTVDWYKCLWDFSLKHKATGFLLQIWEHKAGLQARIYWTGSLESPGPGPECFQADACAFLELLLSDECRHPCGVVAGSIDPALLDTCSAAAQKQRRYMVDLPQTHRDRLTPEDESAARAVRDNAPQDGSGRLEVRFRFATKSIILGDLEPESAAPRNKKLKAEVDPSTVPFCVTISSALLLYRLLALFSLLDRETRLSNGSYESVQTPVEILRPEVPDSVWYTEIAHVASGTVVRFGDYRGAASVWAKASEGADMDKLKGDLESLLELLCGEKSPHTYDKVVAGHSIDPVGSANCWKLPEAFRAERNASDGRTSRCQMARALFGDSEEKVR
ncbi:hypothetical protein KFL_002070120 [Klebsormidium nitens]|uniref:Uncharacterized protein n=1 Tax=Klebsormidium nitens TaxID=105231 RepID=A0A1Y1I804_KLENI|nr:hypothetical protein KFL_002070120 [Klebsormidium nitens]|eukprot:GAQ84816.1 hypothetical protein KFL_002070120 [Klebsormidium nitens]